MLENLSNFFASAGFEPHGHCFLWDRTLLWLYIVSDGFIAFSYYVIPIALVIIVRKRRDLVFNWMFLMFSAFIFACGTTHLMGVWTLWQPVYWLDGSIKAMTAGLSFATALMLWPLIPKAVALPSPSQLEKVNGELQKEVGERERALERLRQSEEQFRLLVEGVHDYAIYLLDPNGIVITWNAGAQRITGYAAEEIVGKHFSCFYTPEDNQASKPQGALEIAARNGQYEEETFRVRKDGSAFWATVLITALHDTAGRLYGFTKIVRDMTERREIESRLRESERLATLGTTAAVFAHEIGNPLNGISTSLQLVSELMKKSDHADPPVGETIDMAQQELQRLTTLLTDYRSFAKPQKVIVQPTELKQVIQEVLGPVSKHYRDLGITLQFEFDETLPLVFVDREKLKQVILNLCKNAVEAMPQGGMLRCKTYRNDGSAVLEISDTGVGIPKGFDPFQLFKTTKPYGTGLGLPIVEQIVSEHHGTITYVSEPGNGTAFITSLPVSAYDGISSSDSSVSSSK